MADRLKPALQHGDPHLANALDHHGELTVLDLEFTAWRLPGYDHAMLWILLGPTRPLLRRLVMTRLSPAPDHQAGFWLNALLVCLRERISHQRAIARPSRLRRLRADLGVITCHLREFHHHPGRYPLHADRPAPRIQNGQGA